MQTAPNPGEWEGSGQLEAGGTALAEEEFAMDEREGCSGQWLPHVQWFQSLRHIQSTTAAGVSGTSGRAVRPRSSTGELCILSQGLRCHSAKAHPGCVRT